MLLRRPQHAARIAAIAAQWTQVEDLMAELLAAAFGSSTKTEQGAHSISANWVARSAIREAETIRVRLKVMDATLGAVLRQRASPLLPEWEGLKEELSKRGRERNDVVHGRWLLTEEFPTDLVLERREGGYLKYTVRDLDDVLDRMVAVWRRCHTFELSVLDAKLEGPQFPGSV